MDCFPSLKPGFGCAGPLMSVLPKMFPYGDNHPMAGALCTATQGMGSAPPNPSVGCVITDEKGQIRAQGYTQPYGGPHAERHALEQLGLYFSKDPLQHGQTPYGQWTAHVTLEPCAHTGKQPPCVDALIASPIGRISVARTDPFQNKGGHGIAKLRAAGKEVTVGSYWQEATAWHFPFLIQQTIGRPMVTLKWAQTLNGLLANNSGLSQWISGPTARNYTHWLRQRYDAIMVGARTWLQDKPKLTARDCEQPPQRQPWVVIWDPRARLFERPMEDWENAVFDHRFTVILTTVENLKKHTSSSFYQKLKKKDKTVVLPLESMDNIQDLPMKMAHIFKTSFNLTLQSIFVEGGAHVLNQFLQTNLWDMAHVFTAPFVLHGHTHRILGNTENLQQVQRPTLVANHKLGNDTLMEFIPHCHRDFFKAGPP